VDEFEYVENGGLLPIEVAVVDQLRAHVAELRASGVLPADDQSDFGT
jgi:hypothetical protein